MNETQGVTHDQINSAIKDWLQGVYYDTRVQVGKDFIRRAGIERIGYNSLGHDVYPTEATATVKKALFSHFNRIFKD